MSLQAIRSIIEAKAAGSRMNLARTEFTDEAEAFGQFIELLWQELPTNGRAATPSLEFRRTPGRDPVFLTPPPREDQLSIQGNMVWRFLQQEEPESQRNTEKSLEVVLTETDGILHIEMVAWHSTTRPEPQVLPILDWLHFWPEKRTFSFRQEETGLKHLQETWEGALKYNKRNAEGESDEVVRGNTIFKRDSNEEVPARLLIPVQFERKKRPEPERSDEWTNNWNVDLLNTADNFIDIQGLAPIAEFVGFAEPEPDQEVTEAPVLLSQFLPEDVQALMDSFQLQSLSFDLDFSPDASFTGLEVKMRYHNAQEPDDLGRWPLFHDFFMENFGFGFQLEVPSPNDRSLTVSLEGTIAKVLEPGTVNQRRISLPTLSIEGHLGGERIWTARLSQGEETENGTLENISDFLALANQADLAPTPVQQIPIPEFERLELVFQTAALDGDPDQPKVALNAFRAELALATASLFEFPHFPALAEVGVQLAINRATTIEQAADGPPNWQVSAELMGQFEVTLEAGGSGLVAMSLGKAIEEQAWILEGSILESSAPITIKDIFNQLMEGTLSWPNELDIDPIPALPLGFTFLNTNLSAIHFSDLKLPNIQAKAQKLKQSISDQLQAGTLVFDLESPGEIPLFPGTFSVTQLGVSFLRSPDDFTANIGGTISLDDDLQIAVSVNLEDSLSLVGDFESADGLPVGEFVGFLANQIAEVDTPESLEGFTINKISATYAVPRNAPPPVELPAEAPAVPTEKALTFSCEGELRVEGLTLTPKLVFEYKTPDTTLSVNGSLAMGETDGEAGVSFDFEVNRGPDSQSFIASADPTGITLDTIFDELSPDLAAVFEGVALPLESLFIAYHKGATGSTQGVFLFGLMLDLQMNFSKLPLAGDLIRESEPIGVSDLLVYFATGPWEADHITAINTQFSAKGIDITLPAPQGPSLDPGANLSVHIPLFDKQFYLPLRRSANQPQAEEEAVADTPAAVEPASMAATPVVLPDPSDGAPGKWFQLNRRLGPLYIARVGLFFVDRRLVFMLETAFTMGPLTLVLDGLSFGSPLDRFEPQFNLRGLGIQFKKPPIEVSGILLRVPAAPRNDGLVVGDRFTGAAIIKTSKLTISAIGEYSTVNGDPSFYLYAYLGMPLGGPAFFFVEGLAAGFGYNRSVRIPEIEQVPQHPMVAIATLDNADPMQLATSLIEGDFIPIDPGKIFFAIGVRFTTFKLLDSFAMLVATFGDPFRIDLMGISKLVLPTPIKGAAPVTPLAEVTLAIKGTFVPEEGFLGVQAQLTSDSYILSRDCTLTGGFAFFSWFSGERGGDFVLSLGGYHPKYDKPSHYPDVPRLGFNWNITPQLSLKGGMYFALVPTAVMAGGKLEAVWEDGSLKAWFIIGADFLIAWKPYHYEASMYLKLGASYTFWAFGEQTLTFEIGADLEIWGPDFAGIATIDLEIISFEVAFGDTPKVSPPALTWQEFEESFIPETTTNILLTDGLLKNIDDENWLINADQLAVEVDSILPISTAIATHSGESLPANGSLGIAPMAESHLTSSLNITISQEGRADNLNDLFDFEAILKAFPKAVWGTEFEPSTDKADDTGETTEPVLAGVKLKLKPRDTPPDEMAWMAKAEQIFNIDNINEENNKFSWEIRQAFDTTANSFSTDGNRTALAAAFGIHSIPKRIAEEDLEGQLNLALSASDEVIVGQYA